ncbi:unnamed protein product, partial [Closterium sp. Naga37s-1]
MDDTSAPCRSVPVVVNEWDSCPAIHVSRSYGVQIGKVREMGEVGGAGWREVVGGNGVEAGGVSGQVYGRIDMLRVMGARIDGMLITSLDVDTSAGAVHVALSGHGPTLLRSDISITNNEIYGVETPIILDSGAIGVTVTNNLIHSFGSAAIRCGAGNRAQCNYVFGTESCYWVGEHAMGVRVRGGACVRTPLGVVMDNGKRNDIRWLIMRASSNTPVTLSCTQPKVFNCGSPIGRYWEGMRRSYYRTPAFTA